MSPFLKEFTLLKGRCQAHQTCSEQQALIGALPVPGASASLPRRAASGSPTPCATTSPGRASPAGPGPGVASVPPPSGSPRPAFFLPAGHDPSGLHRRKKGNQAEGSGNWQVPTWRSSVCAENVPASGGCQPERHHQPDISHHAEGKIHFSEDDPRHLLL